jgi:CxxC motif-containing protein (DUF1111 family)
VRSTRVGLLAFGAVMVIALHAIAQRNPFHAVPVDALTPAQELAFEHGSRAFSKGYRVTDGLGPLFNEVACVACHGVEAARSGNRRNTHFGLRENDVFDPLAERGGSLVQSRGIGPVTTVDGTHSFVGEVPSPEANVITTRETQALQGLGFVDAVPDATWLAIAEAELAADPATAGRVHVVFNLAAGSAAVGKFGWKAQVPTLFQFAGDALLNEIGITSPGFRDELCPQGDCRALAFNPTPALNDDGTDVAALTDFMTMLAAPARGTITSDVTAGEAVFVDTGCARCHRPTIETGPSAVAALDRASFHPYSDFLLHDMGSLGDGIGQGDASGREMRTTPLWGLRNATRFLHDGSVRTFTEAILRHDGQGRVSRDRFTKLGPRPKEVLLAFLKSL